MLSATFDSRVVTIGSVNLSADAGAGTVAASFSTPGTLIALATLLQPMTASGTLLNASFTAVGACGAASAIHITSCVLDGGAVGCTPRDGVITVRCP